MAFCDFCNCQQCQNGYPYEVWHAPTIDGRWICDVCYRYDLCTADGPDRNWNGPCEDFDCIHRPKLSGDWVEKCRRKI